MREDRSEHTYTAMTFSVSRSVAESSVYRAIYNDMRGHPLQHPDPGPAQQANPARIVDYTNRWTFLHKLLAIEAAHDRRRMDREQQGKSRQQHVKTDHRSDKTVPDLLSRWLYDQVLEDSPDEPAGSILCSKTPRYLPTLDTTNHTSTCVSHAYKHTGTHMDTHSSAPAHQTSDHHVQAWPNAIRENDNQTTPTSDRTTPVSFILDRQSDRENQAPEGKPRRRRQLRLPPILLPRMYTVTPRPLQYREFLTPTKLRGPITDEEWEDLRNCRYIRHSVSRFALPVTPSNLSAEY